MSFSIVEIEGVRLLREIGDEDVLVSIIVDVGRAHPHARFNDPGLVVGDACQKGRFPKCPVALIQPQLIGCAVVGDVDVDAPIGIKIGAGDSQTGSRCPSNARPSGNVDKLAVAFVPIEGRQ